MFALLHELRRLRAKQQSWDAREQLPPLLGVLTQDLGDDDEDWLQENPRLSGTMSKQEREFLCKVIT